MEYVDRGHFSCFDIATYQPDTRTNFCGSAAARLGEGVQEESDDFSHRLRLEMELEDKLWLHICREISGLQNMNIPRMSLQSFMHMAGVFHEKID